MARILLIDDEANIRTMVGLALRQSGHEVETAADGEEGLERFSSGERHDLVLLDQRMPGLEGLDVLREIRRRHPAARVIMVTAFGTIDLAIEAMKAGATDFLRKPFTLETLRGAVEAAVSPAPGPEGGERTLLCFATVNGYQFASAPAACERVGNDRLFRIDVRDPSGHVTPCTVTLAGHVAELVKAHADREAMPGGDRFWQGLCEEALANFVWQHAQPPEGGALRVEELTAPLQRWAEAVLSAA
jgi:DNA-binding response OmpR family regulator